VSRLRIFRNSFDANSLHLINLSEKPNHIRVNGVTVEDAPREFYTNSLHSIYYPVAKLLIPLSLDRIPSGFVSRKRTLAEYKQYPHMDLIFPM
jgi:hypothetical protein